MSKTTIMFLTLLAAGVAHADPPPSVTTCTAARRTCDSEGCSVIRSGGFAITPTAPADAVERCAAACATGYGEVCTRIIAECTAAAEGCKRCSKQKRLLRPGEAERCDALCRRAGSKECQ